MILDKENIFSLDQAVTATALSADMVDLGPGDTGPAEQASLFVNAGTAFAGTGSLVVELTTADELNAAGTALDSPTTVATFPVSNDQLTEGGKLVGARLPHGMKRYARLHYRVTGTVSAGQVTAGLVWDVQAAA